MQGVSIFLGMIKISLSNFRFLSQMFGGAILLPISKIAPPNGSYVQDAMGTAIAHQCRILLICSALDKLLQPVLLDSASSSRCCTFPSNFCVAMRNSFVRIRGEKPLFKAKFGTTPHE